MNKKTAISRSNSSFPKYTSWLESGGIEYEVLDWQQNNYDKIKDCSSLVLTGGADIFPEFYADWEDGKNRDEYLPDRDGFEFKLADYALSNGLPVLAICRGLQLMNVKLNGSLINDIETIRGTNHRKIKDGVDRMHDVKVMEDTLLYEIVGKNSGTINSSHHQSADRIGEGLRISAKSPDGIIEALEWAEKDSKPFLLCVQWHPERMADGTPEFAVNILKRFRKETEK